MHQFAQQFTCAVLSLQVKRYPVKATYHSSFLSSLLEEFPSVVEKMSSDDDLLTYTAIAIALKKKQSNKKKSRSRWSKEWYLKRVSFAH
jgi:hypothetical protein